MHWQGCRQGTGGRNKGPLPPLPLYCSSSQQRGAKGAPAPCAAPSRQGRWGLALVSPSSKDTFWLPSKSPQQQGCQKAGMCWMDTWVAIGMGCVLLFLRRVSPEAHGSSPVGVSIPCCGKPSWSMFHDRGA